MADSSIITAARLREVLDYDPHTGWFTWRVMIGQRCRVGARAGTIRKDRRVRRSINIDGRYYAEQNLAWLYMTGRWPEHEIDHENTDATDNHWENLRPATRVQNNQNTRRRADNTSGFKGVHVHENGRYYARVQVNGKRLFVGSFETLEEATAAITKRRQELHGEFCNHG